MAIVALKKISFCGLSANKLPLLESLQKQGCAHLIALRDISPAAELATSKPSVNALRALKYLNQCANKRHQIRDDRLFDFDRIVEQVLSIQHNTRIVSDKRDALIKRIREIEPWGDFSFPDEQALQGLKLWFYCVPERLMTAMKSVGLVWQQVHQDNLYSYIVVVGRQEPPLSSMPVPRTHVGKIPLSTLKGELNELELALEDLQADRESLTRWIGMIAAQLAKAEDESALRLADSIALDSDGVFIIQAWAPERSLADIERLSKQHRSAFLSNDPEVEDSPPTLLKNPERLAGGEELVNFYHPPAYFGWDPSVVVFFSFVIFFSMILSDAGYAGFLALLLIMKWQRLGKTKKGLRLRRLAMTTVCVAMLWGALTGSYFGASPTQKSVLHALKLIDINDFNAMMQLSIAVGVAHIVLANGIMCYQHRGRFAFVYLGWCFVAIGGFLLWNAMPLPSSLARQSAYVLLTLGGLMLLLFSSERRIVKPIDWLWRILEGCKSLTGITGLFGDVLSYIRLFALGLSSASLALIFNQLAEQTYHSIEGAGLLLSLLILVLGHALNLLLCLMSGLVHGLRLNFIEFYRWGVPEEGYPFKAFSKKGVYQ